jgi:hypothetical protein
VTFKVVAYVGDKPYYPINTYLIQGKEPVQLHNQWRLYSIIEDGNDDDVTQDILKVKDALACIYESCTRMFGPSVPKEHGY